MKNILVTGADGFIGSHLTELLLEDGYNVKALSLYNSFNSFGWLDNIENNRNLKIISGDIRDPHYCNEMIKGTDTIFNLAALIAIPYSYYAPASYIDTNVMGTFNICQAAKTAGGIRIIHISTSEVYGTAKYIPIDEQHPFQPQSPYSASKIGADAIAMSFYHSFGLPVTIARPFNTYGPRQSARAVIPTILSQIASGKKRISLGEVRPTRDFNYVLDTSQGLVSLAKSDKTIGETFNIGSGTEISIQNLFYTIRGLMKSDCEIQTQKERFRPENSEVLRLICDNTKIHTYTGYKPAFSLEMGLTETIKWFLNPENLKYYKIDRYNI